MYEFFMIIGLDILWANFFKHNGTHIQIWAFYADMHHWLE